MMDFPPPQLPHLLFHYDSIFHSSFFIQHYHHDLVSVLPFIPSFPLVPAHSLGTKEKVTERF